MCVGRATAGLQCKKDQICREWRCTFTSLHELMCAIEASWIVPGTADALGDTQLEVDADFGPNMAPPAEPLAALAPSGEALKAEESMVLKGSSKDALKKNASVTAMTFAGPRGQWLFTGFGNGHVSQWSVMPDENGALEPRACNRMRTWSAHRLQVSGMAGSPDGQKLFTFSLSSVVRGWATATAECVLVHRVTADVGGIETHNINCLVLHELVPDEGEEHAGQRRLAFTVGLDSCSEAWADMEEDSDGELVEITVIEEEDDANLLSFDAEDGLELAQWKQHAFPVRGLAVVPGRFLVSAAQWRQDAGGELIVWNMQRPGEVLRSLSPWRLRELCGLALHGTMLVCMMDYGHLLSIFDLEAVVSGGRTDVRGARRQLFEGQVEHWQIRAGRHLCNGDDDEGLVASCLTGDSCHMAASNEELGTVTLFDLEQLKAAADNNDDDGDDDDDDDDYDDYDDDDENDYDDESDSQGLQRVTGRKAPRFQRRMIHSLVPFPTRPLKDRGYLRRVHGGPEVVAVRGSRVVAGYADGSVRMQLLSQPDSPAADEGQGHPASFQLRSGSYPDCRDSESETDNSEFSGSSVRQDGEEEAGSEEYESDTDIEGLAFFQGMSSWP